MLFDLPAVAERARARFAERGITDRGQAFGGDFLADALPRGADVVSLIRVAFDHDDETVLAVLRAARSAMAPGTTLLLAEPMAGTPGAEPVGAAYFGLYLWAMGRGRPRTPAQLVGADGAGGLCRHPYAAHPQPAASRLAGRHGRARQ